MTINRREFLKRAYQIGGLAGLYAMGGQNLINEALAKSTFISGHVAGAAAVSYASWDEATELVNNSAVWLMEGGAATNETGVDNRTVPITGADLILTQSGGLAAATGSPPSRLFDGTDDYLSFTQNCSNIIANGTPNWTVLVKLEDATDIQTSGSSYGQFSNGSDLLWLGVQGGLGFQFVTKVDGGNVLYDECVDQPSTTGMLHLAIWGNGTYTRAGFVEAAAGSGANGQPTKWSDFGGADRVTVTAPTTWQNGDFSSARTIMRSAIMATCNAGKLYYVLFSDTCLIDNAN